jgi:hypothetical protein
MSVNESSKIVIYASRVILQIVALLTDVLRGIIYARNLFIVKATGHYFSLNLKE